MRRTTMRRTTSKEAQQLSLAARQPGRARWRAAAQRYSRDGAYPRGSWGRRSFRAPCFACFRTF